MSHDIYNPWHGCRKISEGCQNCYMYFMDRKWDRDGSVISKSKSGFKYPVQKFRNGEYKIQSGENIRVCMTSDFFLEEADQWRPEVWEMLRFRSDVIWTLLTKRADRIAQCLPDDWGDGYENVRLGVTAENQKRADERIPILLNIPAKHKYVCCAPLIGPVNIQTYLRTGKISQVLAGGENYDGCRPCDYEWLSSLYWQCRVYGVEFNAYETGTIFFDAGTYYRIPGRHTQGRVAYELGLYSPPATPEEYKLFLPGTDTPVPDENLYVKSYHPVACYHCASRHTCNGCSRCGNCCC